MRARIDALLSGIPFLVLAGCVAVAGCARTGAPPGWLSEIEDAPADPYGSWITAELDYTVDRSVAGEFLAVTGDSLYIMDAAEGQGSRIFALGLEDVRAARIAHCDPNTSKASGWVAAGTVSTFSHGFYLVFTLPTWLMVGSSMAGAQSRTALEEYPERTWEHLGRYARFPQGPPPDLYGLGLTAKRKIVKKSSREPVEFPDRNE